MNKARDLNSPETIERFAAAIEPARAQLLGLVHLHDELADPRGGAAADSPWMADIYATTLLSGPIADLADSARSMSDALMAGAGDHVRAHCNLLAPREPVLLADKVLARSSLEACGRAVWLLDPAMSPEKRWHRAAAARYELLKSSRAEALAVGSSEAAEDLARRADEHIAACTRTGLVVVMPRRGPATFGDEQWPSTRAALRQALAEVDDGQTNGPADLAQTWLSGSVHSTIGSILQLIAEAPAGALPPDPPMVTTRPLARSAHSVAFVLALATRGYIAGATAHLRHRGPVHPHWSKACQNAQAQLASMRDEPGLARVTAGP